jgi:hypothetical protein
LEGEGLRLRLKGRRVEGGLLADLLFAGDVGNVVVISDMDWRSVKMEAIPLVLPPKRPAARPKP